MLFVYVITMDAKREARTREELNTAGIQNISIVNGVDGSKALNDPRLSYFCKVLCTDRIRGCALAHANAWKMIADSHHYDDDSNIVLIVEDDVRISKPDSFIKDVHEIVHAMRDDWDVISLFCQGICSPSVSFGRGSTAAYLLSKRGSQRLHDLKIGYHVDLLQNSLAGFLSPLVDTYDNRETFLIGNQTVAFWGEQDILSVGDWRLTNRRLCLLLFVLLGTAWMLPASARASRCVLNAVSLYAFVFALTLFVYFSTPASLRKRPREDDDHKFLCCVGFLLLFSFCSLFFLSCLGASACIFAILSLCLIHGMNRA